ncbi:MAG: DUF4344 domain-containing metallopeptidase [Acidobacteria bacterium]|nr:DUF4344 domain-containing metallopeptidase [Acidobacteriota bacterium]
MRGFVMKFVAVMLFSLLAAGASFAQMPVKAPVASSIDKGDFKVGFSPKTKAQDPKKAMPAEIAEVLKEIATAMNEIIALPYDVFLNFDTCGEPNAFYNPGTKEITMCYEFISYFEETYKKGIKDKAEVDRRVDDAVAFFFFHELGHCLIDAWQLPATGREEDAVDQLATLVMLDGTPEGVDMVISAAIFFDLVSASTSPEDIAFWDEHSVDQQRMYDTLCLTYGSDPVKNKGIVASGYLPKQRAERCSQEFKRIDGAWNKLLTPYLKVQ